MNVVSGIRQVVRNPIEACYKILSQLHERGERSAPRCPYLADDDWRQRLGITGEDREQVELLCQAIDATLIAKGIKPGPESYLFWNDGDRALVLAIWCLVRRLHATKIVETGVAHGVTSRIILEAMGEAGRLWSIDLPPQEAPEKHREIGIAVGSWPGTRWSLTLGSSRRYLPGLLAKVAPIDLFVHDSNHSRYNTLFEMTLAWDALRPGGAMVVDDVDASWAFDEFSRSVDAQKIIAEAEPVHPDMRRFNKRGLFGVLLKPGFEADGAAMADRVGAMQP